MTPGPGGQFDHLLKNMKSKVLSQESGVETEESRVIIPKSEGETIGEKRAESRVESEVSGVKSLEPAVNSLESRVKTGESSVLSPESRTQLDEVKKVDSEVKSLESRIQSLDLVALDEAIKEANVKPKLGVYSPLAAAMLRYKAITTPRYSMGSEMKTIIERALKEAYPQLYEEVQKRMNE